MTLIGRQRVATLHKRARSAAVERRAQARVFYESKEGLLGEGWWVSTESGDPKRAFATKGEALEYAREYEEDVRYRY